MGLVDAVVLALIAMSAWLGIRAGFVDGLYGLATLVLAVAAGIAFQGAAADAVQAVIGLPQPLASMIGFVAVIFAAEALFAIAGHLSVRPLVASVRGSRLSTADHLLGTVPAVVRAVVIVAIVVVAIQALPLSSEIKAAVETSRTARIVGDLGINERQIAALATRLGGTPLLVTKVGEDQSEPLALPDELELSADPVAERQLFDLVNEERLERGRSALVWDERLVPIARAHSSEMFERKYFSHESPATGSPFDRLRTRGISYTRAGENLAYAQSVGVAHRALMDSPGHRENILRPEFTRIGIGVVNSGVYGRMFTQLYLTP